MTTSAMFDYLIEALGINADVVSCMTAVNGYNEETALAILYWATGYRNFEQVFDLTGDFWEE